MVQEAGYQRNLRLWVRLLRTNTDFLVKNTILAN